MKRNNVFHKYLFSLDEPARVALAAKLDTSIAYLQQISYGIRQPSPKFALRLSDETRVPKSALRPDLWGDA